MPLRFSLKKHQRKKKLNSSSQISAENPEPISNYSILVYITSEMQSFNSVFPNKNLVSIVTLTQFVYKLNFFKWIKNPNLNSIYESLYNQIKYKKRKDVYSINTSINELQISRNQLTKKLRKKNQYKGEIRWKLTGVNRLWNPRVVQSPIVWEIRWGNNSIAVNVVAFVIDDFLGLNYK